MSTNVDQTLTILEPSDSTADGGSSPGARAEARPLLGRLRALAAWWNELDARGAVPRDLVPFRRLALQLHVDLPRDVEPRTALVVTPTPSSLFVPALSDLARCLADELRRPVLLADAGLDAPEASLALGAGALPGLADRLAEPTLALERLTKPTSHEGLSFLPAGTRQGPALPAPPEALGPLLASLQQPFDFVLLGGGALLRESMALALAPHVGCVLILAVENETRLEDLDAARELLALSRARRVALVLTK